MIRGAGIFSKERVGGDDHTRYAKPALHRAVRGKTFDKTLTPLGIANTFYRLDPTPFDRPDCEDTRIHEAFVQNNGAGTALALAAPLFYPE